MSRIREVDFYCPHCREKNSGAFHMRIDARSEPEEASRLLAGTLSEVTCGSCRERSQMEHSLVFVDEPHGGAIWLDPPNDRLAAGVPPLEPMERLRRVTDSNALRELAAIWRDGLDDGAMLLLKHMLAARMLEESGSAPVLCAYEDRFNSDGQEWLEYVVFTSEEGDPEGLRTPFATYRSVAAATEGVAAEVFPAGKWVDWDDKSAQNLWEAMQSRTGRLGS